MTSEVLPAIRRTGGYIPAKDLRTGERLSDTQIVRQAERILLQTIGGSNRIADGCVTSSDIAKSIGMNVKDFYRLLVKDGVIAWKGGRYTLTARYDGMGLAQVRNFHYFALDGKKKERTYLVWTREGADFARQTAEMLNQSLFV